MCTLLWTGNLGKSIALRVKTTRKPGEGSESVKRRWPALCQRPSNCSKTLARDSPDDMVGRTGQAYCHWCKPWSMNKLELEKVPLAVIVRDSSVWLRCVQSAWLFTYSWLLPLIIETIVSISARTSCTNMFLELSGLDQTGKVIAEDLCSLSVLDPETGQEWVAESDPR